MESERDAGALAEVQAREALRLAEARGWAEVYRLALLLYSEEVMRLPAEMVRARDPVVEAAIAAGRPEAVVPQVWRAAALAVLRVGIERATGLDAAGQAYCLDAPIGSGSSARISAGSAA